MHTPRATRIHLSYLTGVATELWMGGAQSAVGEPLSPDDLRDAWVIDCAGDMPEAYRAVAGFWRTYVLQDYEERPASWESLSALAHSIGRCLAGQPGGAPAEHPPEPPPRVYVFCNQGLNRSGLFVGRILRALGLSGEEALATVTAHRPGSLNNLTFARLVRDG